MGGDVHSWCLPCCLPYSNCASYIVYGLWTCCKSFVKRIHTTKVVYPRSFCSMETELSDSDSENLGKTQRGAQLTTATESWQTTRIETHTFELRIETATIRRATGRICLPPPQIGACSAEYLHRAGCGLNVKVSPRTVCPKCFDYMNTDFVFAKDRYNWSHKQFFNICQ